MYLTKLFDASTGWADTELVAVDIRISTTDEKKQIVKVILAFH